MAYLIYDISKVIPEDYPLYFFDANVWISGLIYYGGGTAERFEKPYQDFVEAIVTLNSFTEPSEVKRLKNQPKIIINDLLVSEILNTFMRKVAMKAYFGGGDVYKSKRFKEDYRDNPKSDYLVQLANLCQNFICFEDYTVPSDGNLNQVNCFEIVRDMSSKKSDFNDFCYYNYLKGKNIPFVTHDIDFKIEDIPIITARTALLHISSIKH